MDDDDTRDDYSVQSYASDIKEAKHDVVDPAVVARQQRTHLTQGQREDLAKVMAKRGKLFDGTLGRYPHRKVHLELMPEHMRNCSRMNSNILLPSEC